MKSLCFYLLGFLGCVSLRADVSVPAFFSDHAVLQKSDKVAVWGKAAPGEEVTVTLDKATAKATTGDDGKWKATLDLQAEGPGPYNLVIQGKNQLSFSDVLVGEVWVCGGQSNMDFNLIQFPDGKADIPNSANPLLRQFKVKFNASPNLQDDVEGKWVQAGPDTSGQFSATAYFFGKKIQNALGVPVGLMNDCVGGTCIESWMSADALASDPDLKAGADKALADRKTFDEYGTQYAAWQKKYGREDKPQGDPQAFAAPGINTSDWKPVTLPGLFSAAGVPGAGAVWIRKTITVPTDPGIQPGKGIDFLLGDIRDSDDVYWNGKKIGSSDETATQRRYGARFNLVQPGDSVLAVRIFNPAGGGGIAPGTGRFNANSLALSGEWLAKAEYSLPPLDATAQSEYPAKPENVPFDPQNVAGYLYNGMIHPVIPYTMKGVIWYQGEANWNHGYQYRTEFPLLIKDWRAKWGQGDFPFYFCQIANYQAHPTKPGNDWGAEVREAQTMTLSVPNTGEAILIDIGEEGNIHPADKHDVGDRLGRIALAKTYGKPMVYSGPTYDSMTVENDKIRVHFKNTDGGLVAKPMPATYQPLSSDPKTLPLVRNSPDGEVEGFAISGDDKVWHWATAKIDGDSVLVWSADVPKPVAVRYAWSYNPWCNIYNGAGLPAGPFRTDDFPLISAKLRYNDGVH